MNSPGVAASYADEVASKKQAEGDVNPTSAKPNADGGRCFDDSKVARSAAVSSNLVA
jgi:hypothetical protein